MASKQNQVLLIEPANELTFKGPFTDVVTSQLELTNPSDNAVCFKVKTTAPKQYCVRPNSGIIPPKGGVKVAVMLQPFDYATESHHSKHKFMVQSAFVPDGETSIDNIFKSASGGELMDSKLRVLFEVPPGAEAYESTNQLSESKYAPASAATAHHHSPASNSTEAELRKVVDDRKRLQNDYTSLERENVELRKRLTQYSVAGRSGASASGAMSTATDANGLSLMHAILLALVAVFVGLLLGKIF